MAYINGNEILFSAVINGGGGGGGEAIPNFNEVEGFRVFLEGLEGEINVGYSVLEKVALPAGYPAILASFSDKNFIADNIKKGVNIFGLVGAFEGEGNQWLGEYVDGTGYKKGAIVSYEGNIYICIKDLDDMQDPTNAEYWQMLNEEGETAEEWNGTGIVIAPIASVSLISFTIDGTEYEAEEGMTWLEWVGSNYAPDSYSCASADSRVKPAGDTYIVDRDGDEVLGRELIHAGDEYSIKEGA